MASHFIDSSGATSNKTALHGARHDYLSIPDADDSEQPETLPFHQKVFSTRLWRLNPTNGYLIWVPLVLLLICALFLASVNGVALLSPPTTSLNNGTHPFKPTVIMISLDGFRSDYLDLGLTPNLKRIVDEGSRAKYMIPSFPTITFPNHYTLATGLYPDSHGIVGNTFFDKGLNRTFNYKSHASSLEPEWWGGEPIWTSVELQGQRSAVHMWPGSEVPHQNKMSSYLQPYNKKFKLEDKVDQLLGWLDLEVDERPTFLAAYIFDVDTAGHDFGPNSTQTREAIIKVDRALGMLLDGIHQRHLDAIINVVVVSDHGMAEVVSDQIIYLDDYVDMNLIASHHVFPYAGLTPKHDDDTELIFKVLKNSSRLVSHWDVYRAAELPTKFRYGTNPRVPPIFGIQEAGWAFSTRKVYPQFEPFNHIQGLHGFDNFHPAMRATFIAKGPAFRKRATLEPFPNIEVYNLICRLLGLHPSKNNGTEAFWNDWLAP